MKKIVKIIISEKFILQIFTKCLIDLVFKSFKGINCQIVILHRGTEQMKLTFSGEIEIRKMK